MREDIEVLINKIKNKINPSSIADDISSFAIKYLKRDAIEILDYISEQLENRTFMEGKRNYEILAIEF